MKMFWGDNKRRTFELILILFLYLFASTICVVESKLDGQSDAAIILLNSTKSSTFLRSPTSRKLQSESSKSDDHDEKHQQQIPDSPSDDDDDEKEDKDEVCFMFRNF